MSNAAERLENRKCRVHALILDSSLTEQEKWILVGRLIHHKTLKEVGGEAGYSRDPSVPLSRERTRQIQHRATIKLLNELGALPDGENE
jgi:DNA-directed RNA polymerase sigma subunit (sigma70/sigma32)